MKGLRLAVLGLFALPALAAAQKTIVGNSTATLSPGVRVGDLLYLCRENGNLICADVKTGKEIYTQPTTRDRP